MAEHEMKTVNSNLPDSSICKLTLPNVPHVRTQPKKQSRLVLVVRVNTPVYKAPPALKVRIQTLLRKESGSQLECVSHFRQPLAHAAAILVLGLFLAWAWIAASHGKDLKLIAAE
jgi:hypothetical protein